jgi:hypothetical protein
MVALSYLPVVAAPVRALTLRTFTYASRESFRLIVEFVGLVVNITALWAAYDYGKRSVKLLEFLCRCSARSSEHST